MGVNPGDELVSITSSFNGPMLGRTHKVKRVTPTGIVVLDDDTRLNPSKFTAGRYDRRGAGSWDRTYYVYPNDKVVARAEELARSHRSQNAVQDRFDEWRRTRDSAEAARALAAAATSHADLLDGGDPS